MRVLLVEDEPRVAQHIAKGLRESGHTVDHVDDGRDALYRAAAERYDVAVLDRMLPGVDGLTILRTMRAAGNRTPVLVLSALGEVDERVVGLEAGGDDYLIKPFAFSELKARLEALARRGPARAEASSLQCADLELDLLSREVRRAGRLVELSAREFRMLEYMMRHAGQVLTRSMILERVWDYNFDPQTNIVDQHVSRLRHKLDRMSDLPLIETVRGAGYRLRSCR